MQLNSEQKEAVEHLEGPLLIFAGAGSGKTRVITNRIVQMIQKGISPSSIVALSFTNKSAREMKERVQSMLSRKQIRGIEISTFHSLGLKICEKFISRLGYEYPFLLLSPSDIELIFHDILRRKKLDPKDFPIKSIISQISLFKNTGRSYFRLDGLEVEELFLDLYEEYSREMKARNALDFDDLILKPILILENFPEVSEYYFKKFRYFMIDEFQDTNFTQYRFLKLLMGTNSNLCVVGDDDQSIYGFRGSNRELILKFEDDFPNTKVIKLLQNYRSTIPILNLANSIIQNNSYRKEKELWSTKHSDQLPIYKECLDELDEAYYVVNTIQELVIRERYKYGEIAILFRTNYQSRSFEEVLRLKGIPYKLIGAYDFFDRREVKDLLAYIRVVANPKDELSLIRILNYPKRGLGENTIAKIQKKAHELEISVYEVLQKICEEPEFIEGMKKNSTSAIYQFLELIEKFRLEFYSHRMSEVLKKFISEIGLDVAIREECKEEKVYKARMLNLSEVVNMLAYFENSWEEEHKPTLFDFLARIAILTSEDSEDSTSSEKVQLMTMHLSKGLEFKCVFLVGLEEGILPSSKMLDDTDGIEEERRLFYVGVTRAKERLFLTSAMERKKFGESVATTTSRFINEIPENLIIKEEIQKANSDADFLSMLDKIKV